MHSGYRERSNGQPQNLSEWTPPGKKDENEEADEEEAIGNIESRVKKSEAHVTRIKMQGHFNRGQG